METDNGFDKPLLLFGVARSGSTPYYNILAEYLRQKRNAICCWELFTPRWHLIDPASAKFVFSKNEDRSSVAQDAKFRFLQDNYPQVFFKAFPWDLYSEELAQWLEQNYSWIFVERRNVREHFLSCHISFSTDLWYQPGGLKIPEGSIQFTPEHLELFESEMVIYHRFRRRFPKASVLYYEDLVASSFENEKKDGGLHAIDVRPEVTAREGHATSPTDGSLNFRSILRRLGLNEEFDSSKIQWTEKQNFGDKLRFFSDPALVREKIRHLSGAPERP